MALGKQIMREKLVKEKNPRKGELFTKICSTECQENCFHNGSFIVLFVFLFLVLCAVIPDVNKSEPENF